MCLVSNRRKQKRKEGRKISLFSDERSTHLFFYIPINHNLVCFLSSSFQPVYFSLSSPVASSSWSVVSPPAFAPTSEAPCVSSRVHSIGCLHVLLSTACLTFEHLQASRCLPSSVFLTDSPSLFRSTPLSFGHLVLPRSVSLPFVLFVFVSSSSSPPVLL